MDVSEDLKQEQTEASGLAQQRGPTPEDTDDPRYQKRTAALARRLAAFVVQSNWPNALNTPERTHLGESKVYAPDGEVLLTLPRDEAGFGVFALGERSFRWTALVA